jgi:hypothetical protein
MDTTLNSTAASRETTLAGKECGRLTEKACWRLEQNIGISSMAANTLIQMFFLDARSY